jgi:anion-transporting  ArsA/GET3 family ATPase
MNGPGSRGTPKTSSLLARKLLFVVGKGGVGKTTVSQAIALALSRAGKRTLWICFEDPTLPTDVRKLGPHLWHLNCDAGQAFEEYATLKIGVGPVAKLFVGNRLVRYLAKAAPGIHELVLLGKVWHERKNFDHVVIDMPSTGYGRAMFHATKNFSKLFTGGPIHRDAKAMLETFSDPSQTGQLIVALPEEMPLQEAIELGDLILEQFPENPPGYIANRVFPRGAETISELPEDWASPVPASLADYAKKRGILEEQNLRIWRSRGISFDLLPYLPVDSVTEPLSQKMAKLGAAS